MKVLIAEDDEIIRKSLLTSLRHIGHDPIAVTDADAAIEAIDREDCQFVIADARIKGVNCLELCRTIRRHGQDPYVYVILLVDHYRSQEMTEGILAGVDDFLTKPLNDAELIARVRYGERIVHLNARTSVIFALARIVESRKAPQQPTPRATSELLSLPGRIAPRGSRLPPRDRLGVHPLAVPDECAARYRQFVHSEQHLVETGTVEQGGIQRRQDSPDGGRGLARCGRAILPGESSTADGPRHRDRSS